MPHTHAPKINIRRIVSWFTALLMFVTALTLFAQTRQANQQHHTASGTAPQTGASVSSSVPSLFLPAAVYASSGTGNEDVVVADMNRDGIPDLVLPVDCSILPPVPCGGEVTILLGNGDGSFQSAVASPSGGTGPVTLAVADVNGDGQLDVVVANEGSNTVGVLLGNGNGTLRPVVTYPSGDSSVSLPNSVAISDVNGDGKPDLIVANSGKNTQPYVGEVSVLLGKGDGTFQSAMQYTAGGGYPQWVAAADINGDGKPDLVVINWQYYQSPYFATVAVLLSNGDGTLKPPLLYNPGGVRPGPPAIADVNGDGKLDIVVASCGPTTLDWCVPSTSNPIRGVAAVLLGNGDGTFQPPVVYDSGGFFANSVAIADVNGDGRPDLLVANACAPAPNACAPEGQVHRGGVAVLLGNGDGTFQPAMSYDSGGDVGYRVAAADVNGDQQTDILVVNAIHIDNSNFGGVGVLLNASGPGIPTTPSVTSSLNPSTYGQAITLAAQVAASGSIPTGTVVFLNRSDFIGRGTLIGGRASLQVSTLPGGSNFIRVLYTGGSGFAPSASTQLSQTVVAANTTTALTSSLNPATIGQRVTFTATAHSQYGATVYGFVSFFAGSQMLGTVVLNQGAATLSTRFPTPGPYAITAVYSGSLNTTASTSSVLMQTVFALTTTSVVSTINPSFSGQAVTFTATVRSTFGAIPAGETVSFYRGFSLIGTGTTLGGTAAFETSSLTAGKHTIRAVYAGDAIFKTSSNALTQVVNGYSTSTSLSSSLTPSIYGQTVTFTASVTGTGPFPPTGSISFVSSGNNLASVKLNSVGVAVLTTRRLNAGTYPLAAVYNGDPYNQGSTSAVVNQVVRQTTTAAKLTSSVNPSTIGQVVTFTARITSPTVTPTGPVTFALGPTTLGTVQLSSGKATFTTSSLPAGSNAVKVTYNGNSNIAKTSAVVTQVVQP